MAKPRSRQETVLLGEALTLIQAATNSTNKTPEQEIADFVFKGSHIFSARNGDRAKEIWAEEVECYGFTKGPVVGIAANEAMSFAMHDAIDEFHYIIDDIISTGTLKDGKAVHRFTITGDWSRPLFGVEPNVKTLRIGGISIWQIKNGKVTKAWIAMDYTETPTLAKMLEDLVGAKF